MPTWGRKDPAPQTRQTQRQKWKGFPMGQAASSIMGLMILVSHEQQRCLVLASFLTTGLTALQPQHFFEI